MSSLLLDAEIIFAYKHPNYACLVFVRVWFALRVFALCRRLSADHFLREVHVEDLRNSPTVYDCECITSPVRVKISRLRV